MTKRHEKGDDEKWNEFRRRVLFFSGLLGVFAYLGLVEVGHAEFHVEFLIGFLAMMGVGLAQGVDKR